MNMYRVRAVTKDGITTFFPQKRRLCFFWRKIVQRGYIQLAEEFNTLKEAEQFLYQDHLRCAKVKDGTKNHPFNPVFHRLTKTNND